MIRDVCEKEAVARERYGTATAASLKNRLADLLAADWIEEIPIGQPTKLFDGLESKYRVNIDSEHYMVLACAQPNPPLLDGSINWKRVRKVKILSITK